MKRRHNLRRISSKRSYTTQDIAELLKVHPQTIRTWMKEGMAPIESNKLPFLFLGSDIKVFLGNVYQKQRGKLQTGECYCLTCRKGVVPQNQTVIDRGIFLGNGKKSAVLTGVCPFCGKTVNRFTSLAEHKEINKQEQKGVSPTGILVTNKTSKKVSSEQLSLFSSEGGSEY